MKAKLGTSFNFISAVLMSLVVTSCGFHLRTSVDFPAQYSHFMVEQERGHGGLRGELEEQLGFANASIVNSRSEAGAVIRILDEEKRIRTLSLSRGGKSNELEIEYRVRYKLLDGEGNSLLEEQKLESVRNYFNDQTDVIGKSNEEALIFEEMRRLTASTMLRRIRSALMAGEK